MINAQWSMVNEQLAMKSFLCDDTIHRLLQLLGSLVHKAKIRFSPLQEG